MKNDIPYGWNADSQMPGQICERHTQFPDSPKAKKAPGFDLINHGGLLDTIEHPNKERYPNQRIFIINIDDYAYLVPFVEDEKAIFLKTIIPSRKMAKKYLEGQSK